MGKGGDDEGVAKCSMCIWVVLFVTGISMVTPAMKMRSYNISSCEGSWKEARCKVLGHDMSKKNEQSGRRRSNFYYVKTKVRLIDEDLDLNETGHWEYVPAYTGHGLKQLKGAPDRTIRRYSEKDDAKEYIKKFPADGVYKCFFDKKHPKSVAWNCSEKPFEANIITGWVLLSVALLPFACACLLGLLYVCTLCLEQVLEHHEETHFFDHHRPPDHPVHITLRQASSASNAGISMGHRNAQNFLRQASRTDRIRSIARQLSAPSSMSEDNFEAAPTNQTEVSPEPAVVISDLEASMLTFEQAMASVRNAQTPQALSQGLQDLTKSLSDMTDAEVQAKDELKVPNFTALMAAKKKDYSYSQTVDYNTLCRPKVNVLMRAIFEKHSTTNVATLD